MDVYFGKMEDKTQFRNHECIGPQEYFGNIQHDDYVFIRLKDQFPKAGINSLWKFDRLDDIPGDTRKKAIFDEVFTFNKKDTIKFIMLKLFKLNINSIVNCMRQSRSVGFFKLDLIDINIFCDKTRDKATFNLYIDDADNYRKICFVNPGDPISNEDVQIQQIITVTNETTYDIYNKGESFIQGLESEFNIQRYIDFCNFLNLTPSIQNNNRKNASQKKAKKWVESSGTTNVTIQNIWDLFCSKNDFDNDSSPEDDYSTEEDIDDESFNSEPNIPPRDYKNLIIYGIPGCGKSYRLKEEYLKKKFAADRVIRTTFHPEYSNTDFVGQIKPVKNGKNLDYEVVPGPFTEALSLALQPQAEKVALVIEEINRGNAAAIFGDIFQLLDRDSSGESEYTIKNKTIFEYLKKNGINIIDIKIPSNLYLYATMNTSDQNVFKLDTAFKRRWEFERLTNKTTESKISDFKAFSINGIDIKWTEFISVINEIIKNNDDISGDRQIGNFFYQGSGIDLERFANKVLEYLYNDVCKYGGKEEIFNVDKYNSFDDIYDAFVNGSSDVFNTELFKKIIENKTSTIPLQGGSGSSGIGNSANAMAAPAVDAQATSGADSLQKEANSGMEQPDGGPIPETPANEDVQDAVEPITNEQNISSDNGDGLDGE